MEIVKKRCLIGLTGTYCAGKNHIGRLLEARGLETLDIDKLGHHVIELEKESIAGRFGASVLDSEGRVDRKALGELVFGKKDELAALEGIVHPRVDRLIADWLDKSPAGEPKVINAALLHRAGVFNSLDFIILVKAPLLTRILRAKKRDRLPFRLIFERLKSQKQFISQYLSKGTDIQIVINRGLFKFGSKIREKRLNHRIDMIFSQKGMVE